jgi:predicted  nucleic acid-binding Zn-ribbon protein
MINNNSLKWKNNYIPSITNNLSGNQLLLDISVPDNSKNTEDKENESTKSVKKQWTFTAFFQAFYDISKNPYLKEELEEQITNLNKELDLLKKKCILSNSTIINLEQKNNDLQRKCANLERNILDFQTSSDDSFNGDSSSAESD